ncbi:NAD(P)H-binding protein [Usitatibacter palustris]|uniref:NAD(P)-binding domain-containing protein n=1 Tax=Usitatibacter palustris TaxID=2732487 RepID=A0A6M4HE75_9PROT|nr:NAD(P)H-binding protein [Usitatibacter palustris]QJR16287.1 hypothetical protein DSM104440_03116 [Usitatibacter palustris]
MRILLLGANGFIGGYLMANLRSRGHEVIAAVRDPERLAGAAKPAAIRVDLNNDVTPEAWMPRLAGIDAVVNCAGVLQGTQRDRIEAIHAAGPIALFQACERAGVKRVVQISAVSAVREAGTAYATSKLEADEWLRSSKLSWTIVRPSLVYAAGAYGGTALFRAIAALPFAVPLPGDGEQPFQPVHVDDVCAVVAKAVETDALLGKTVDPVGPGVVTLREVLADLRRWMGLGEARFVKVPMALVRFGARLGDWFGGPANTTAIRQLEFGNVSDSAAFRAASGIEARGWREGLDAQPAQWQDRWHARLYFVRPLLRVALGVLWLASAVIGSLALESAAQLMAVQLRISASITFGTLAAACVVDFVIGLLVLTRWRPGLMGVVQVAMVLGYTAAISVLMPATWVDPFGAVLKNIVILPAILALAALEQDR